MKQKKKIQVPRQPEPFTPGITKEMVREHAQRLLDERLLDDDLLAPTDWVLVERDLLGEFQQILA